MTFKSISRCSGVMVSPIPKCFHIAEHSSILYLVPSVDFIRFFRAVPLNLICLGRGAEAMSSRASNSERLRMPAQKGLFFRPARSEEAFYRPPKPQR